MRLRQLVMAVPVLAAAATIGLVPVTTQAASGNSDIRAEIVARAITLTNDQGMDFGQILPFSQDGFVQINSTGSFTVNNAQVVNSSTLRPSAWSVTGVPSGRFTITLPADTPATTIANTAGDIMQITGFTHNAGTAPQLNTAGNGAFAVGARLNVRANQQPGIYTGTFNVTVNYL